MKMLSDRLDGTEGIIFLNSAKPEGNWLRKVIHPIYLLFAVFIKSLLLRRGKVLIFSSAFKSFWEKCVWVLAIKAAGSEPFLMMVDGNYPRFYQKLTRMTQYIARAIVNNGVTLVAQSNTWKNYYGTIFPNANIEVVSAGIDTDFFCPRKQKKQSGPVRIIYVGWMIEEKGIFDLLSAAKIFNEKKLNFNLILIGPLFGNEDKIVERINRYDLTHRVFLKGPVSSREGMRSEYRDADIFVFPSHFEGFPMALLEAIACGLPCIGTNVGGIPDIFDGGNCGILVEKQTPELLADAIGLLIEDQNSRELLGKLARRRAVENYSIDKCIASYIELLSICRKDKD